MKTLIFHGSLKTLCPQNFEVEADTVAEALSALQNLKTFQVKLGEKIAVMIEGFNSRDAIYDKTDVTELHIHPAMLGSGAWARIIVGTVLVVVGAYFGIQPLISIGISMVLGGIAQLLAPQPSSTKSEEKSRYLSGQKNTVAIGTRIPILYGRRKVYGHYLSFDIDSTGLNSSPASWYASSFTNYDDLTSGNSPPIGDYSPHLYNSPSNRYDHQYDDPDYI